MTTITKSTDHKEIQSLIDQTLQTGAGVSCSFNDDQQYKRISIRPKSERLTNGLDLSPCEAVDYMNDLLESDDG